MTGLQLAMAGGALIAFGVVVAAWWLAPADPDLADALERLSPAYARRRAHTTSAAGDTDVRARLGRWGLNVLPAGAWARTPTRELAILRVAPASFYGEKLLYAFVGLLIPTGLTILFNLFGAAIPVGVPLVGTLGLAGLMFVLPDHNVRDEAKKARAEFARALGAYIDLVALERTNGAGPRQAMETAADIGDSWVFQRLAEELARTRWSGLTPWEALHELAADLSLPELDDLADIIRLSGEEGAAIYSQLRARSAGMRTAMLNHEKAKANEIGERMSIPMSLLGVIFLGILVTPALLRVMTGTS